MNESPTNAMGYTQVQKIIAHIFYHPEKEWWYAADFMQPHMPYEHPHYVGYEATARMSDAITKYNDQDDAIKLFDVEKDGKFRIVRVKWPNFRNILKRYPDLIPIAERTQVLKRFEGLTEQVQDWKPEPPKKKSKFKSYAR